MEPDLDIEGRGDEALRPAHLGERVGFVDRQTPGTRKMDQKQIVLHQIAPKAGLGQIAAGQQKHKAVAGISVPRRFRGLDQAREEAGSRSRETELSRAAGCGSPRATAPSDRQAPQ